MSKSLKLVAGDLSIGSGRTFETVSGSSKLAQDLELWILEHLGNDPDTPEFGSLLDGGTSNGVQIPSFIGEILTDERVGEIKQDISTLLAQYQQGQVTKMQREMALYNGNHTLSPDEILYTVDSIEATSIGTEIITRVSITTLAGNQFRLTIPLEV